MSQPRNTVTAEPTIVDEGGSSATPRRRLLAPATARHRDDPENPLHVLVTADGDERTSRGEDGGGNDAPPADAPPVDSPPAKETPAEQTPAEETPAGEDGGGNDAPPAERRGEDGGGNDAPPAERRGEDGGGNDAPPADAATDGLDAIARSGFDLAAARAETWSLRP